MAPADLEFLALQEALVGRYSLERELGRGGMGVVYLARDVRLDRPVALKLLPRALAAQPTLRERFLREARTAAKLSHPHIVPIHSVEEAGEFVFMVMAFVEGETLGRRIRERGPLPPSETARVLREVSWALAYAHGQGIVHRDVKPDNILMEAGSGRALVMDFGIALATSASGVTSPREVLGTAEFMSPEQASGDTVDGRSDLYSLGVVGYYMITGRLPFEGGGVAATLAQRLTRAAPPIASVAPEAPRHLAHAIDRCLAKDPANRFAGGEELVEALGRSLSLQPEIPAALRAFISDLRERFRGTEVLGALVVSYFGMAVWSSLQAEPLAILISGGVAALLTAGPFAALARMARRLLRSGYGHSDLVAAMRHDLERRKEELAAQSSEPRWFDRVALLVTRGGVATMGVATLVLLFATDPAVGSTAASLAFLSGIAAMLAAPVAATRLSRGRKLPGRWWLKFWESRAGEWLFRLAGLGLERPQGVGATFRATEIAIGLAADRLYEELPEEVRESLRELPSVVRALEVDAEKVRARVAELTALMDEVDTGLGRPATAPAGGADTRESLARDLRAARDAGAARLAEILAALEAIRLGLLRLHAGTGGVTGLTSDLGAARALTEDVKRLRAAEREVEELLGSSSLTRQLLAPVTPVTPVFG
jgi:serine/threonine-protein kinase